MKRVHLAVTVAIAFWLCPSTIRAQTYPPYSLNIVGYVNRVFQPGASLFGNPLLNTNNSLSALMPQAPEGTAVSLWDSSTRQFSETSIFQAGSWSLDLSLYPGTGALLTTPSSFTNTFVGTVLAPDGSLWLGESPLGPPPAFQGADGLYLCSSRTPLQLGGSSGLDVFEYILGRLPEEGEQFITVDPATQQYRTTTFSGGAWDNGSPVLNLGEAAFFNVGPTLFAVPEPSMLALSLLGAAIAVRRAQRRR